MKVLARQNLTTSQNQQRRERDHVESDFNWNSRPARNAGAIVNTKPMIVASDAEAATVQQTADSANDDAEWRNGREDVAGDAGVTGCAFGEFDARISSEQRAENRFSGG